MGRPRTEATISGMDDLRWCPLCKQLKSKSDFYVRRARKNGLQGACKSCMAIKVKEHRRANPEVYAAGQERRRQRLRTMLWEYLSTHPCVDCGESDPVVLEFDHVSGQKVGSVMHMARRGLAVSRILSEIEKCEVRCCNCHTRVTFQRSGSWRTMEENV